jgi:CBS domain-containing protein
MSGFVFALPATSSVEQAAALMAYEGVGQIVVTGAGGKLLGMVSALDLVRYYAAVTTAARAGTAHARTDRAEMTAGPGDEDDTASTKSDWSMPGRHAIAPFAHR